MNLGEKGEEVAVKHLRRKGYKMLGRNFKTRFGEIDIIAAKKDVLIIVEVKSRSVDAVAPPRDAVNISKQRKIILATGEYINRIGWDKIVRFDVIEVIYNRQKLIGKYKVNHLESAFELQEV